MSLKELCKSLRLAYVAEIYESIPTESLEKFFDGAFLYGNVPPQW